MRCSFYHEAHEGHEERIEIERKCLQELQGLHGEKEVRTGKQKAYSTMKDMKNRKG